jgi:hypothetical protein
MLFQNLIRMRINKSNFLLLILFLFSFSAAHSQSLNWESLTSDQKHIVNIHAGMEYAIVFGASYSYRIKSPVPILLNVDFSIPAGENIMDDFKTKIGGEARLYKIKNFQFSASIHGIYRRYENQLVSIQNFGSEMKGVVGYYKPKWFAAVEVGFDKAIVSHFKHSDLFKELHYSNVKDGWYEPATGGNFNFGLQSGYSFQKSDIIFKFGRVVTQDFKTTPGISFYAELGYNFKMP